MDTFVFSAMPADNNPDKLVGRDFEIDLIKQAVLKSQNISIVGDARIGKTSVLKSLEQLIYNDEGFANIIPVYIDFKKLAYELSADNDLKIDNLLDFILDEIYNLNSTVREKFENNNDGKKHLFSKVVRYCSINKLTILLMLDKFDLVTVLRNLDSDFFTYLRGNAYEKGLSIITASRSRLETLCHKGDIAGSHFWNIFKPVIILSVLEDSSYSDELLSQGISSSNIKQILLTHVGNHPCFLKVAGNVVLQKKFTDSDSQEYILECIYKELIPFYDTCFELLKKDESNYDNGRHYKLEYISTLLEISREEEVDFDIRKTEIINLKELGYLISNNGKYNLYSPLFERYLKEYNAIKPEAYNGDKPYIFVSYAHEDKKEVFEEINNLIRNKYRVWFDEGLKRNWREELESQIINAETIIVYFSTNSIKSNYVRKEIACATDFNKEIIPVHLNKIDISELHKGISFEVREIQAIMKYDLNELYSKKLFSRISHKCKE